MQKQQYLHENPNIYMFFCSHIFPDFSNLEFNEYRKKIFAMKFSEIINFSY